MNKNFILLLSVLFFINPGFAQVKCAADIMREKLIAADPSYKKSLAQMDESITEYIKAHPPVIDPAARPMASTQYFIPCVVHVIYDGDATTGTPYNPSAAQITGAINYINQVYDGTWTGTGGAILGAGDLQIKLVLATKNPANMPTTGIDRIDGAGIPGYSANGVNSSGTSGATELSVKSLSSWDPERYYNIWIVNKIDGCTGIFCGCSCDAGFVAGYAYFPMPNNTTASSIKIDGTIMLASQMKAGEKTLPHEIGHALNLYHPFQGNGSPGPNSCPDNTTPAASGDMCADTDPVTNPQLAPNTIPFACRTGINTCSGLAFTENTEKNYMNYTNCYQLFTTGQRSRMQASGVVTQRASLFSSWANGQGAYPAAFVAPVAAVSTPVSANIGSNVSGILNISLSDRTVYSLNATQDGGYLDNSTKWYDVFQINQSTAYTLSVTLQNAGNNSQLGVWIDYDNNGSFSATEKIYLQTNIASGTQATTISIPFTTPASWTGANNFVRMRLTNDLSTIYGISPVTATSATLAYGQSENYAVYLTGGALPLKVTGFSGTKSNNFIHLKWSTTQEINAKSFDVERSVKAGVFKAIANVPANGTTNGAAYNIKDADIHIAGDYLYRLKMIDIDGSFSYSNILTFYVAPQKKLTVSVAGANSSIYLVLPYDNGHAAIRLVDAAGRVMYTTSFAVAGANQTLFLQNRLPKGVYILEALINEEKFTEKLFVR